jgi:hypothetical protein
MALALSMNSHVFFAIHFSSFQTAFHLFHLLPLNMGKNVDLQLLIGQFVDQVLPIQYLNI